MGRQPCCDKVGLKKGPWTAEEDKKLINFILTNGQCCWRAVPKLAGLLRCGKSCRLRWTNYLRPDLKRGLLSEYEENMVIDLHAQLGNRWSKIASHLTGRTDNEIKNHWNTHIKKKLKKMGIDPQTHKPLSTIEPPPPILQEEEEKQEQSCLTNDVSHSGQNKEPKEASPQSSESSTNQAAGEEDPSLIMTSTFDTMELMEAFCLDEVPLIEPDEMWVPSAPASSSTSTSSSASSSSSSSSSSSCSHGPNNILEDLELPDIDWPNNWIDLWSDDLSSWDFPINDINDSDGKLLSEAVDPPNLSQCPTMFLDQDSWTYGLL